MNLKNAYAITFIMIAMFVSCTSSVNEEDNKNKTDVSLFLRSDSSNYVSEVVSESGYMFETLGHHGPAVENEYIGIRFFFNENTPIDIYSKKIPGLELKDFLWYPSLEQQEAGAGMDMYKVGSTVGLGGVRLWDGENVILLSPVTSRIARVQKEDTSSYMELISKGIAYKNDTVDIQIRVTVFSGKREAVIEAEEINGKEVQFATGVNYHEGNIVTKEANFISVWGIHPEDIAGTPVDMGAAIVFNPTDIENQLDDSTQVILISKPMVKLKTIITSSTSKEKELNSNDAFVKYAKDIIMQ